MSSFHQRMDSCGSIDGSKQWRTRNHRRVHPLSCINITGCCGIFVNGCIGIAGNNRCIIDGTDGYIDGNEEDESRSSVTDTWCESEPKKLG